MTLVFCFWLLEAGMFGFRNQHLKGRENDFLFHVVLKVSPHTGSVSLESFFFSFFLPVEVNCWNPEFMKGK